MTTTRPLAIFPVAAAHRTAACSESPEQSERLAVSSLNFEEQAAGRAGLTAYEASRELARRAFADPAQDWITELERVADQSPLLADLESASRDDTTSAAYASDLTSTDPEVVAVDLAAGEIAVTDCLDGAVVDAKVQRAGDGRWLVTERTQNLDQSC